MSTFSITLRIVSILVGGISLFNLITNWAEFGLSSAFETIIQFYETITYPIIFVFEPVVKFFARQFSLTLPDYWGDVLILYLIVVSAMYRVLQNYPLFQRIVFFIYYGLLWPIGLPTIFFFGIIFTKSLRLAYEGTISRYARLIRQVLYVISACVLFLITNAFV